jgi:2-polyprenyl-3-methyl-5-hydroxy-6-metoxy-1,4-benzoquinol methylase
MYESGLHEDYRLEEANRRRTFRGLIRSLRPFLDLRPPRLLLDVGASTGLFLDTFHRLYPAWSVNGVEASQWAVAECRQLFGRELLQGMVETIALPPASQDLVTMLDLIEHLHDPLRTLRAAHRCLKPKGLLVLTTPNVGSVPARVLGSRWWGYRQTHVLYLGPVSVNRLLRRAGFRLIRQRPLIKYFNLGYCLELIGRGRGWPLKGIAFPLPLGDMLVLAEKEAGE